MAHLIRSDNQGNHFCEHCGLEIFTDPCAYSANSPEMVKAEAEKAKVNVCKYCFSAFH